MAFITYNRINQKIFDNKLLSFLVRSLRLGGFIMDENQSFAWWHSCRSASITLAFFFSSVLGFMKLVTKGFNPICLSTTFIYLTTSIAYMNIFFRERRLSQMLNFLQADMDKLMRSVDKGEEKIFKETCRFTYRFGMMVYVPSLMAASIFIIDACYRIVSDPENSFSFEVPQDRTGTQSLLVKMFPFKAIHDDLFLGFFYPISLVVIGSLYVPLWPVSITILMSYVNFKWKILHKRMSEMDISKVVLEPNEVAAHSRLTNKKDKTNYLRTRLCKFCIQEQIRIRWFMDELQELIHIPVFVDFIVFSVIMCFVLYEMASGKHSKVDFFFMGLYEVIMATILLLYHWNGTLVTENSNAMCFAAYSSEWYNYSLKVQELVRMIMLITSDPVEIKAFFVTLKISTFIDIVRAAYTYFNILRKT